MSTTSTTIMGIGKHNPLSRGREASGADEGGAKVSDAEDPSCWGRRTSSDGGRSTGGVAVDEVCR